MMPDLKTDEIVTEPIAGLDRWLDSMRQPGGYGGPVVHWWRDCLDYTGPGLDWRYEGIIIGYLNLWKATGEQIWLAKAKRAGDDLVNGQLPSGNYRNSQFELNPSTGGTPHEAACDLALLELAKALKAIEDPNWERYYLTARRNLTCYSIDKLWDETAHFFRDDPGILCFVPNKAATLAEALFALSHLSGEVIWAEKYALPTLDAVLAHQVTGGDLDGAIYQNSFGSHKVAKFFPYYIARCIPGLLQGWIWRGQEHYAEAARRAAHFLLGCFYPDGSLPQVVYPHQRINRYPQWVAAMGDVLRVFDLLNSYGTAYECSASQNWLFAGQQQDGAFRTAVGFGRATPGGSLNDPRDDIPVVGWNDKAFRYLTTLLSKERFLDETIYPNPQSLCR